MLFANDYSFGQDANGKWWITYRCAREKDGPFNTREEAREFLLFSWELEYEPTDN